MIRATIEQVGYTCRVEVMGGGERRVTAVDLTLYDITRDDLERYVSSLCRHIQCVRDACHKLMKVNPDGVYPWQIEAHDASKWLAEELGAYANWHEGPKTRPSMYARAWLHHMHHNPHHWNHWVLPGKYNIEGVTVNSALRMPSHFACEMIADWHGASVAYTQRDDISGWLTQNAPRIILHPDTARLVRGTLTLLGYPKSVTGVHFAYGI